MTDWEAMQVIRELSAASGQARGLALTVGSFDGVHRGHRSLLDRIGHEARSRGLLAGALTFTDLPFCFFRSGECPALLTLAEEKVRAFADCGLDLLWIVPFDAEMANTPAREFMTRLRDQLGLRVFVGGPDFALGRGRAGTIAQIALWGRTDGFEAIGLDDKLIEAGAPISSTRCRNLLAIGEVELAREFLGRPFTLHGRVVGGDRIGRTIGVPTINLLPEARKLVPGHGVYAVRARWSEGQNLIVAPAALNIGVRPTIEGTKRQIEFHALDRTVEVAPREVEVEFVVRLREERRFDGLQALATQLRRDIDRAREVLEA